METTGIIEIIWRLYRCFYPLDARKVHQLFEEMQDANSYVLCICGFRV